MAEKRFHVAPTNKFDKNFDKLSKKEKKLVVDTLLKMEENPFYPSLRTKKLHKLYESSVNMDIRIIWRFEGSKIIATLDVGHHDVIRKYNKRKLY
jgi:mRNA-degrading endonuclease RelE of RelBE toxin-antitoxin system